MDQELTQHFIGIDAIFQYTGSSIQLISGMLFYIVISRMFSTQGVGAIALFLAIIGLFNTLFSFGLGSAAQHFTSYSLGKGDFASVRKTTYKLITFGFLFAILGFVVLIIMSTEISVIFLHSASYSGLVRMLSVVLLGNIFLVVLNGAILGIQNFRLSALINIAIWTTYYFGSVIFALYVRSLSTIIMGWTIGVFLGVAVELFFIISSLRKFHGTGNSPDNTRLFKYSLPILFTGLISYGAFYADRFIVSGLLNLASLGIYNFALLIASSIGFLVIPFNNILMPKFSEMFGRGESEGISAYVKVSTLLLSSVYVPAALGIAVLAPSILNLVAGTNYSPAAEPLRIIMIFSAMFVSANILVQAIASVRKTKILIVSSAVALGSNLILSFGLIPLYGIVGAAFGFSSIYLSTFIVLYVASKKQKICSLDTYGILKVWISSSVMYLIDYLALRYLGNSPIYLPLLIVLGFLIYIMVARFLRIFNTENKDLILSMFPEGSVKVRKLITHLILH